MAKNKIKSDISGKKKSISFSLHLWLWRWCGKLGLGKMYSELFIPVVACSCPSPLICTTQRTSYLKSGRHKTSLLPPEVDPCIINISSKKERKKEKKEGRRNYTSTDFFYWRFAIIPNSVFSGASRWKNCMIHFWNRSFFAFFLCNVWEVTHIS